MSNKSPALLKLERLRRKIVEGTTLSIPPGAHLAPTPKGLPLVGNHFGISRNPMMFMMEARRTLGDVVRIRVGPMLVHGVFHPDNVQHILQERHRIYTKNSRAYRLLSLVLGQGLLTSDGALWLRQRRIAQPAFHRDRIAAFGSMITRFAVETVDSWTTDAERGRPINVLHEMMEATLKIVTATLLGSELVERPELIGKSIGVVQHDIERRVNSLWSFPPSVPTYQNLRFRAALRTLDSAVMGIIEERRRKGHSGNDLLGMLMDARDEDTGEGMNDRQLRDEAMTMFLAGHETTANALTWSLYLLALHPEARERLHREVDAVLGDRPATLADLPKLTWTQMVIQESMRLYPPAWMVERSPSEDDYIDGYLIPKGSIVVLSPFVTHRHPDVWPEPDRFDPERFTPERMASMMRFAYFPFGGGPRLCIGNRFAMMEAQIVLATIAQRYRLELVPGQVIEPEPLVTLRPKHGMYMTVHARETVATRARMESMSRDTVRPEPHGRRSSPPAAE